MNKKEEISVTFTVEEIQKIKTALDIITNKIESQFPAQCSWVNPKKRPNLG